MVVCNGIRFITAEQLRQAGTPAECVVLEPVGRNTAPALALAALLALVEGGDPILLVMPADHLIGDTAAFREAIVRGAEAAADGAVVTFGITPDRPETGYGLHPRGAPCSDGAVPCLTFVEEPDAATAQQFRTAAITVEQRPVHGRARCVRSAAALSPDIRPPARRAACGEDDHDFFASARRVSRLSLRLHRHAVMERLAAEQAAPWRRWWCRFAGWSDVGAWDALWQGERKTSGQRAAGDVFCRTAGQLVFREPPGELRWHRQPVW